MALGALEAVELGLGKAEEGGSFDQGEVVLQAEGAEAEAEVARGTEDKAVEGVAVVGGVLLADEFIERPSTRLRVTA